MYIELEEQEELEKPELLLVLSLRRNIENSFLSKRLPRLIFKSE